MEVLQVDMELGLMRHLYEKHRPRRVLEIGCWDGGTLREWMANCPDVIVAIDPNHRNQAAYEEWLLPGTDLIIGTGLSQSPEMVEVMQDYAPYDWVFIDGDHDAGAVGLDVYNTLPLTEKGSIMLLHDIAGPGSEGPLGQFQMLARDHQTLKFVDGETYPWSTGIGVVFL